MISSFQSCAFYIESLLRGVRPNDLCHISLTDIASFCELLLGTAMRLHAKVKTRPDSHSYQSGLSVGEIIRLENLLLIL
jgi:hypothetical protein